MTKDFFLRKIQDIKHRYGEPEAEHFKANPQCAQCPEKRIAALTVHHVHGVKNSSEVVTLCFNCHMLVHAPRSRYYTYEDHIIYLERKHSKKQARKDFHLKLLVEVEKGKSLRAVGREFKICHNTVRNAINKLRKGS